MSSPSPIADFMKSKGFWLEHDPAQIFEYYHHPDLHFNVSAKLAAYIYRSEVTARIDTAQFAQNFIRDALAVDADTRKISRFGAVDDVLQRFIDELEHSLTGEAAEL